MYIICFWAADQIGQVFDSVELIHWMAGDDLTLLARCVEVARLVRRRLTSVDIWDGMIEELGHADLGDFTCLL